VRILKGDDAARTFLAQRQDPGDSELPQSARELIRKVFGAELDAAGVVERILADVRQRGDEAVRHYNAEIDGVRGDYDLEVSSEEIADAHREVEPEILEALRLAQGRIESFHEKQLSHSLRSFEDDGIGQVVRPIERVGLYVPGTAVVYPSTVLMTALPARAAGVSELIMATPCAPDGTVSPLKLVAADLGGVSRIFRAGGVQGVAAMAYGTGTVPAVNKICGPGNVFVTLAKRRLYGEVGVDGVYGPSETLVIADESADPDLVAADLIAAAEHDSLATSVLITTSEALAVAAAGAVDSRIQAIARADIASESIAARGAVLVASSDEEAINLANEFAPEHLCLHVADPERLAGKVTNAGCVFIGDGSVESIGDYTAGPSHVMPTSRSATFSSPLGVHDFLKVTSIVRLRQEVVDEVGPAGATIARAEGLTGHAESIEARLKG
jgi:histidinol dehydrogenase